MIDFSALKDCAGQGERSLDMPDKYHALRCTILVGLLCGTLLMPTYSGEFAGIKETLQAIQDCMARSPAPWPDEW